MDGEIVHDQEFHAAAVVSGLDVTYQQYAGPIELKSEVRLLYLPSKIYNALIRDELYIIDDVINRIVKNACQLLGDAQGQLSGVAMHSATKSYLKKLNLIETERDSTDVEFETYQGRRVTVDDGCPVENGVYTTYLFGGGAIAYSGCKCYIASID